jgi:hypothetical protein
MAPPGCDDDSRNPARHELGSACDSGMALAHVPGLCEPPQGAGKPVAWPHPQASYAEGGEIDHIAVQHLRLVRIWLIYMQNRGNA